MGPILPLAAERQIRHARSRHPEEAAAVPSRECPRDRAHEGTLSTAMKSMANAKAVGPDGLSVELLNSASNKTGPSSWSSIGLPPSSGARGKSHSSGKTRSLSYSTRRATRRSAETTAASRSCHTRVRFSLKWFPRDWALTVQ